MIYMFIGVVSCLIQLSEQKIADDASSNKNNSLIVNSDDDDLDHALLLVDMLKTEYLKLLRSRSGVAESSTQNIDLSICAATTVLENPISIATKENIVSHKEFREPAPIMGQSTPLWHPAAHAAPLYPRRWPHIGTASDQGLPATLYNVVPQPSRQRPFHRRIGRHWGRFFPNYYFYNVHPPRQFFEGSPLKKRPTKQATASPATVVHTTAIQELLKLPTKSKPSTTSSKATTFPNTKRTTKHRPTPTTRQRTTKRHTFHKKSKHMKTKSITTANKNPVVAEVASELLKEFKQINITLKAKAKTSKPSVESASTE